jgi:UDP-N-acetylmuramate--alanine ligase
MNRDWSQTRAHFIGIGGSGMSGIARIMAARGALVSGSDIHDSPSLKGLRSLGITVHVGHKAENVGDANVVIRSSAIPADNPEVIAAKTAGITVVERAEALSALMLGKRSVAIAGTHGKTTTTSMLTVALQHCGFDPSFSIGATVRNSGTNAHHGSGDTFIVEADESDGSFTAYKPLGAIITNIELDHVDNFKNLEEIEQLFREFVHTIQPGGFIVLCADDPGAQSLIKELRATNDSPLTILTYGEDPLSDVKLDRIVVGPKSASARVVMKGRVLGEMELSITGRHNILNAAGALAAAHALGANPLDVMAGLKLFTGARRRFEVKGVVNGITVIDDYGHHPTEIRATLETARIYAGTGRVFAVFQPHRYSRTQAFSSEFAKALSAADHTYLLEVYAASEKPIAGVTSSLIASKMEKTQVSYEPSMPAVVDAVSQAVKSGDLIITLGAGDVSALGPLILHNIESSGAES